MQAMKHLIRLEVEKNVFSLIENEPELKEVNDKLQILKAEEAIGEESKD